MRVFGVFALCLFVGCSLGSLIGASKEEIGSFAQFMRKYNKKYESNAEFQNRFQIFRANMKRLEQLKGTSSASYNVTKFADMTVEEFRSMPCGVDKLKDLNDRRPDFQAPIATAEDWAQLQSNAEAPAPTNFDWLTKGAVTPVKNQEQCGSCWAFSTIGNIEGVWFLAGNKLVGLAEQELVDCTTESQGCDGGWPFWALTDILGKPYNGEIDTEASYPYTAEDGTCAFSNSPDKVGATVTAFKSWCTENTADCTEDNMVQLLLQYGPLSACLDALPMQYYQSGIDNPSNCDPDAIDHCITITGYGEENGVKYWKIKNSWGTDWGESGYYRLIRGIGACGINKVITIATAKK